MAHAHYKKARIDSGDGERRVIVTVEFIDDERGLMPGEFTTMRKGILDRIMVALPGRHFNPNLCDTKVKNCK